MIVIATSLIACNLIMAFIASVVIGGKFQRDSDMMVSPLLRFLVALGLAAWVWLTLVGLESLAFETPLHTLVTLVLSINIAFLVAVEAMLVVAKRLAPTWRTNLLFGTFPVAILTATTFHTFSAAPLALLVIFAALLVMTMVTALSVWLIVLGSARRENTPVDRR